MHLTWGQKNEERKNDFPNSLMSTPHERHIISEACINCTKEWSDPFSSLLLYRRPVHRRRHEMKLKLHTRGVHSSVILFRYLCCKYSLCVFYQWANRNQRINQVQRRRYTLIVNNLGWRLSLSIMGCEVWVHLGFGIVFVLVLAGLIVCRMEWTERWGWIWISTTWWSDEKISFERTRASNVAMGDWNPRGRKKGEEREESGGMALYVWLLNAGWYRCWINMNLKKRTTIKYWYDFTLLRLLTFFEWMWNCKASAIISYNMKGTVGKSLLPSVASTRATQ